LRQATRRPTQNIAYVYRGALNRRFARSRRIAFLDSMILRHSSSLLDAVAFAKVAFPPRSLPPLIQKKATRHSAKNV